MSYHHGRCESSCERSESYKQKTKYCCTKCGHENKLKIKYPAIQPFRPVNVSASLISAVTLNSGAATTIIFTAVAANSVGKVCSGYNGSNNVYNPATGIFTVPRCGSGFYNLTTHVTAQLNGTDSPSGSLLVEIRVNNLPITQTTLYFNNTFIQDGDLTINYPLQPGQTVTVVATANPGSGNISLINPATNFSLSKITELTC